MEDFKKTRNHRKSNKTEIHELYLLGSGNLHQWKIE